MKNLTTFQNSLSEALTQLELLGYKNGDPVFLRLINTEGIAQNLSATFPNLSELPADQNAYVVVNGGGNADKDVTQCRAIFYEHDDLEKSAQLDLWQTLNLPEPTFQVDTGGKSVHSYWTFSASIAVDPWRPLESDLLEFADADRSIKNPSRIMRLAGSVHQKTGQQATIVSESGKRYSFEELRTIVPKQAKPEQKERPLRPTASVDAIPLTAVLKVEHRSLIDSGCAEGGRNDLGFKLACDLIGCEAWLQFQGTPFDGDAEDLFYSYCRNCSPSLDDKEADKIWRSATGSNPQPCLSADKLKICVEAAQRNLSRVQKKSGPESKQEDEPGPEADSEGVKTLIANGSNKPPQIIADSLNPELSTLAESLGLSVEPFILCLLPILASRLRAGTRLEIDPATEYYAPSIIWAGLVGDSGTLKSPILRALTSPLDALQQEAFEEFKDRQTEYEIEAQKWDALPKDKKAETPRPKPPALKDLYFSDFTIEAIGDSIRNYPEEGSAVVVDELAAFFKSMDAYRGGKGSDRQRWLTAHGGSALKVNRKSSEPIYLSKTSISIVGGIQPSVLEKQILDDPTSEDGLWARFIWFRLPITTPPGISDKKRSELPTLLKGLYHSVNQVEATTYSLSEDAKTLWNDWNSEIGALIKQEPSGILRASYPKLKEVAARIALVSHVANSKLNKTQLEQNVSKQTLEKSIQFTRWLIGQTQILYCEIGTGDNPEAARLVKFVNRFKGCGWVKAKAVTHWSSSRRKLKAADARKFMASVVALGFAKSNGEPETDPQFEILVLENSGNLVTEEDQSLTQKEIKSVTSGGNPVVTLVTDSSEKSKSGYQVTTGLPKAVTNVKPDSERDLADELPGYRNSAESENLGNIDWQVGA